MPALMWAVLDERTWEDGAMPQAGMERTFGPGPGRRWGWFAAGADWDALVVPTSQKRDAGTRRGLCAQQIPCGNDRKKSKDKCNSKGKRSRRMTGLFDLGGSTGARTGLAFVVPTLDATNASRMGHSHLGRE